VGRSVKGLGGEGVRLLCRNADFSGVFTGRGLFTRSEVDLVVGGELAFPLCCVGEVCFAGDLSRLRGSKLLGLAGLDGEG
jgi:hypothetical protein